MSINNLFGLEERALRVTENRAALLSKNIANASTPHFKAKDIDFQKVLQHTQLDSSLSTTNRQHINPHQSIDGAPELYRIPMQKSLDGNTVEDEIERKNFMDNSIRYQASLSLLKQQASSMIKAIKGE